MVSMLLAAGSDADRAAIERAMIATVTRLEEPDDADIIAALDKASNEAKVHLLAVLPQFGGEKALQAIRGQLSSSEANVQNAAVRALADWPDSAPLSELLEIAKNSNDLTRHVLALRGYINLLALPANLTPYFRCFQFATLGRAEKQLVDQGPLRSSAGGIRGSELEIEKQLLLADRKLV